MDWTKNVRVALEKIPRYLKNQRTLLALEKLMQNMDKIPVEEIEKLVEKYE